MLRLSSQSVVYQRIVKDVKMALFAPDIFLFSNNGSFSRVFVKNILNRFRFDFSIPIHRLDIKKTSWLCPHEPLDIKNCLSQATQELKPEASSLDNPWSSLRSGVTRG